MGMDDIGHRGISARCLTGLHIRNQMRQVIVTRFGEMNFVSFPLRVAFLTPAGFRIIRRTDQQWGWGKILRYAPAHRRTRLTSIKLLDPDAAQDLNRRNLAKP